MLFIQNVINVRHTYLTVGVSVSRRAFTSISIHNISTCSAILTRVALALIYIYKVKNLVDENMIDYIKKLMRLHQNETALMKRIVISSHRIRTLDILQQFHV
jgi:hypothetical protein